MIFLELIAPTPDRAEAAAALARRHVEGVGWDKVAEDRWDFANRADPRPKSHQNPGLLVPPYGPPDTASAKPWHAGLGPHAPYSVCPALLEQVVALSRERRVPVAFHLAESRDELEYLRSGTGRLARLLEELGARAVATPPQPLRPLDFLENLASADRSLVIHGNYLDDEELAFLAANAERMSLVYCPRTHEYFAHDPYPLEKALAAGVAVALGTDSRASSPDLSVLEEMRAVSRRHPAVPPSVVLRMGTLNGAKALGLASEVGSLEPGKRADLAIVPLPDGDSSEPERLVLDSHRPVVATWLGGRLRSNGRSYHGDTEKKKGSEK